jgi:2-polyprenyl-3-methyl-5-hydroxy-6-metoxy-1,4-benzoquinol methylase
MIATAATKSLEQFIHDAQTAFPVLARTLAGYTEKLRTEPGFPHRGQKVLDLTLKLCDRLGLTYDDLLDSYAEFCFTFLREQEQFLKTGEFSNAAKGFDEVHKEVYLDDEYMRHYMLGHLLSCAVFPHHYRQYLFFMDRFVPAVGPNASVCEFGYGHGLWLSSWLAHSPARTGIGYDISPQCVKMAREMLQLQGIATGRYQLHLGDAVKTDLGDTTYDAMIASGLLEHIEDPLEFLRRVKRNLRTDTGRLFVMVPTNTAHPDHLVLFNNVDEIRDMFAKAGLGLVEECVAAPEASHTEQELHREPMVYLGIFRHVG